MAPSDPPAPASKDSFAVRWLLPGALGFGLATVIGVLSFGLPEGLRPDPPQVVSAAPDAGAAPQPAAQERDAEGWGLSEQQRRVMVESLSAAGAGNPVWFTTDARYTSAQDFQAEVADVFAQAGWEIQGNPPTQFQTLPGLFFFEADAEPPAYALSARAAFEAANITLRGGSGYLEYYRDQKEQNLDFRGFEFAPDQSFLIVIGRKP